jgi:TonB family protein
MKRVFLLGIIICGTTLLQAQVSGVNDNLRHIVSVLTSDSLGGRAAGTRFESRTASYLMRELEKSGAVVLFPGTGQDFSFIQPKGDTLYSRNVLAMVEGTDSILKHEYIIVAAHYDHLGNYKMKVNGKDSLVIYRGADDNASGVACLLQIAGMVSQNSYMFKRSVIFAAFGAEEQGMTGSWYFANRAFGEISKVDYVVNLDMVGRSGGNNILRAYTVVPDIELNDIFALLGERTMRILPKVVASDYFPSDHQPFVSKGIPVTLFTTGLHSDYHTLQDTPDKLDYNQMEAICEYIFDLVRSVSDRHSMLRRGVLSKNGESDPAKRVYGLTEVEKMPSFVNGNEKKFLDEWVYKYIKYPEEAISKGLQGRALVQFVIEKDGSVTNVEIVESAGQILDDEAVKVVKASPKWKPARLNGQPVRARVTVPVEFRLRR